MDYNKMTLEEKRKALFSKPQHVNPETVQYKINADFEIIGNGSDTLRTVMGISAVIALAYLMFNLFTPPCFAAIGAMNSEINSKKWLFGGVGFQFGMGYSISFLVAFFGNLFTKASFSSIWMPILGWAVTLLFAGILTFLIIKNKRSLKNN